MELTAVEQDEMIEVLCARGHNHKNVNLKIPRNKLVVISVFPKSGDLFSQPMDS